MNLCEKVINHFRRNEIEDIMKLIEERKDFFKNKTEDNSILSIFALHPDQLNGKILYKIYERSREGEIEWCLTSRGDTAYSIIKRETIDERLIKVFRVIGEKVMYERLNEFIEKDISEREILLIRKSIDEKDKYIAEIIRKKSEKIKSLEKEKEYLEERIKELEIKERKYVELKEKKLELEEDFAEFKLKSVRFEKENLRFKNLLSKYRGVCQGIKEEFKASGINLRKIKTKFEDVLRDAHKDVFDNICQCNKFIEHQLEISQLDKSQLDKKINELQRSLDIKSENLSRYIGEIASERVKNKYMQSKHQAALARKEQEHQNNVEKIKQEHNEEIERMRQEHNEEIERIKHEYQSQVDMIKSDFDTRFQTLEKSYQIQERQKDNYIRNLKSSLSRKEECHKKAIEDLSKRHEESISKYKYRIESFEHQLDEKKCELQKVIEEKAVLEDANKNLIRTKEKLEVQNLNFIDEIEDNEIKFAWLIRDVLNGSCNYDSSHDKHIIFNKALCELKDTIMKVHRVNITYSDGEGISTTDNFTKLGKISDDMELCSYILSICT